MPSPSIGRASPRTSSTVPTHSGNARSSRASSPPEPARPCTSTTAVRPGGQPALSRAPDRSGPKPASTSYAVPPAPSPSSPAISTTCRRRSSRRRSPTSTTSPVAARGLATAVAKDRAARACDSGALLADAERLSRRLEHELAAADAGALPQRVVHNDAKLDNVLVDSTTGAVACIVDLDTVMAGTVLNDFGELARTAATTRSEDEPDVDDDRARSRAFRRHRRADTSRAPRRFSSVRSATASRSPDRC